MHILYNAQIHTLDPAAPTASAIVIDHGLIRAIGDQHSILSQFDSEVDRLNMEGRTVIPGLVDAHIHLQNYSLSLQRVECETRTLAECLDNLAARAKDTPTGDWILGHGWNQNEWSEGFGNAEDLDKITSQHPVYLTAKSLHAAWVNSTALKQAGISADTQDLPGGRIQRNEDGSPTGILFETAMRLISDIIPDSSAEQVADAIDNAQAQLWELGLTGVHDFDQRTCFVALQQLHAEGRLKLRVTKSIPIESLSFAVELGLQTGFGDDVLRIGSIKAFADGALGPRTAAMFQPYKGEPENRGILILDAENIFEQGSIAVKNGLSLAVHAIGDAANHEVLQAFTQLRELEQQLTIKKGMEGKPSKLRHRIEHVQLIHPDDLPRLAKLDVIASMQPIHATSDFPMADQHWGQRSKFAYAWRSLLEEGTQLAFGSDAPVESPNPFWGLHAAVTRKRADGSPSVNGWYPEQKLSLTEALRGFTSGAVFAAGMEDRLGKLAPGFLADLLVLEQDIFHEKLDDILDIHPSGTMIAGEWVHLTPELDEVISSGEHLLL